MDDSGGLWSRMVIFTGSVASNGAITPTSNGATDRRKIKTGLTDGHPKPAKRIAQ